MCESGVRSEHAADGHHLLATETVSYALSGPAYLRLDVPISESIESRSEHAHTSRQFLFDRAAAGAVGTNAVSRHGLSFPGLLFDSVSLASAPAEHSLMLFGSRLWTAAATLHLQRRAYHLDRHSDSVAIWTIGSATAFSQPEIMIRRAT
jgi:hypothetical protein